MEPRLILFDVDGTLVNTDGAGRRAMERAFHSVFGVESVAQRARGVRYAGMTDRSIIAALARAVGVEAGWSTSSMQRLRREYLDALRDEMQETGSGRRVLPGVPELLESLDREPGAYLGLITGNLEEGARTKLEPFGLNRFFPDGGFGCEYADRAKVAWSAHDKATRRTGLEFPASRVFVVGDTELDVFCAQANGFRSIAVASGFGDRESLEASRPDVLLEDLADTARVLQAVGAGSNPKRT